LTVALLPAAWTETDPDKLADAKIKAACTNCRKSHVACSHEQPCSRCVTHGLASSCSYLPRKKRTNFKKRKRDLDPHALPSEVSDVTAFVDAQALSLQALDHPFAEQTNDWLAGVLTGVQEFETAGYIKDEQEDSTSGSPSELGWGLAEVSLPMAMESESSPFSSPSNDWQISEQGQVVRKTGLESLSISSKTFQLLSEMKEKNQRLETLLRKSLTEIKVLKERERLYEQQQMVGLQMQRQHNFKLFSLAPAKDFNHIGVPAIACFSLTEIRRGYLIQCNEAFRELVGRPWQELFDGFSCTQLFPKRFLPVLCQHFKALTSSEGSLFEGELSILRGNGDEMSIKAYTHIIFDNLGQPLYKMFYAFALND